MQPTLHSFASPSISHRNTRVQCSQGSVASPCSGQAAVVGPCAEARHPRNSVSALAEFCQHTAVNPAISRVGWWAQSLNVGLSRSPKALKETLQRNQPIVGGGIIHSGSEGNGAISIAKSYVTICRRCVISRSCSRSLQRKRTRDTARTGVNELRVASSCDASCLIRWQVCTHLMMSMIEYMRDQPTIYN